MTLVEPLLWRKWDTIAEALEWGIAFDASQLQRVCWADDNIVVPTSPTQLRNMFRQVDALLPAAGMFGDWTDRKECPGPARRQAAP